jgi:predicted aspartyl protease
VLRLIYFLLFLIAGVCVSGELVLAEPIPFTLKRGVPEIEVTINDSIKASFIIDTGADQVYIDKTFAEEHGLLSGGKMPMRPTVGVEEATEAFQIFLRSLMIGDERHNIVNSVVIELPVLARDSSRGLPNGVLGYSFLKDRLLQLNYVDSTLEFLNQDSTQQNQKAAAVPFNRNRHLIIVNAIINDSTGADLILDTGASYTIFSPALADKLNLPDTSFVAKINLGNRVTSSNVKVLVRDISALEDPLRAENVNGVLGTTFLQGRRLVIDYGNDQLLFYSNK